VLGNEKDLKKYFGYFKE